MNSNQIILKFDSILNRLDDKGKELRDGLSGVVLVKDTLWLACDETTRLDRLTRISESVYGEHQAFPLSAYLDLPARDKEEADIEGLDVAGGYLWLVRSHSLKRDSPKHGKSAEENRERLAKVSADGNRFLLARIPLIESGNAHALAKETTAGGARRVASQLQGDRKESDLTKALRKDKHFAPFFNGSDEGDGVPGKDNGFDIEGLAVSGDRVFIGLRGPVLRGWATILEVAVVEDGANPSVLRLQGIGPAGQPYLKHFLALDGLGVRDLCILDGDLLILAGPTMNLDGPVCIYRWHNGARQAGESVAFANELQRIDVEIPFGVGIDHAEGMALLPLENDAHRSILLVYDSPSEHRKEKVFGDAALLGDVFHIPR